MYVRAELSIRVDTFISFRFSSLEMAVWLNVVTSDCLIPRRSLSSASLRVSVSRSAEAWARRICSSVIIPSISLIAFLTVAILLPKCCIDNEDLARPGDCLEATIESNVIELADAPEFVAANNVVVDVLMIQQHRVESRKSGCGKTYRKA